MIDFDVARNEVTALLEGEWGVDIDGSLSDTKGSFEQKLNRIVKCVVNGSAVIDGDEITYTCTKCDLGELKFSTPKMSYLKASDGTKENDNIQSLMKVISRWAGVPLRNLDALSGPDLQFVMAVFVVFFSQ